MSLDTKVRPPVIDYQSIKINGVDIQLSTKCKGSFVEPYNKIIIKYKSDISLSKFLARVTFATEDYDLDKGAKAVWQTNIPAEQLTEAVININSTNFSSGDGLYRIGLYAQSMLDHSWDITYLFFTVDDLNFAPADADNYEVLTTKEVTD